MTLKKYFEQTAGTGVLSTADNHGQVNSAIYARPHFPEEDDTVLAFIMTSRLSYNNIQSNPHAAYLFIEDGQGYRGKRLYLKKTAEDSSPATIKQLRRKSNEDSEDFTNKQVVYFKLEKQRPLVGDA